jgi:hypothetical protein
VSSLAPSPSSTGTRPRLRTSSGTPETLQGGRDRPRAFPPTVPATRPRLSLRGDQGREGSGESPALVPEIVGGLPPKAIGKLRTPDHFGDLSRAPTTRSIAPPPRGETKADSGRSRSTTGLSRVHRSGRSRDPTVLPDSRGVDGRECTLAGATPRCEICRTSADLTVDHILPRALGGPDTPENTRPLCRRCNSVKGGRIVSDEALRSYRVFQLLIRRMGLGIAPPALGCVGPAPMLNRLAQFADFRAKGGLR